MQPFKQEKAKPYTLNQHPAESAREGPINAGPAPTALRRHASELLNTITETKGSLVDAVHRESNWPRSDSAGLS